MTYNAILQGDPQPVILVVCPPSHDQQGRKFAATMQALEGWPIERLYMADTLDRHNGRTHAEAYANGSAWLDRHREWVSNIPLTRWDDLRADASFARRLAAIQNLYADNQIARNAIDRICRPHARLIYERLKEKGHFADPVTLLKNSINYMLEEIAGLAIIRSHTTSPEVYPNEYFMDPDIFDRLSEETLSLPRVIPISFARQTLAA